MAVSSVMMLRPRHAASVLALSVSASVWVGAVRERPPARGRDLVERLDPALALLRKSLPGDARVGLLLPAGPFSSYAVAEIYFAAQYALAPLLVRPVVASDCVAGGAEACGAGQIDFFITDRTEHAEVAAQHGPLRLLPVAEANGVLLSRRRP
jgi:hypothetical protein